MFNCMNFEHKKWTKVVKENCSPVVVWAEKGRVECYDENALKLNIEKMKKRLETETMNMLTYCALELSIEHLESGLNTLCDRI